MILGWGVFSFHRTFSSVFHICSWTSAVSGISNEKMKWRRQDLRISVLLRGRGWDFLRPFLPDTGLSLECREKKSLHHVVMVVKFLNDNKPKTSLKKWIHTVSNIIDFIQFHLICQILAKFLGLNPKGRYLSVQKGKEIFYVVFTCSIKRAREIRKFHVAVVQRRLRNMQKSVTTCKVVVLLI